MRRDGAISHLSTSAIGDLPGIAFMPEASWGRHTRWLTVITVDPASLAPTVRISGWRWRAENIESRPVWKPMHLQPVFADCEVVGGAWPKNSSAMVSACRRGRR